LESKDNTKDSDESEGDPFSRRSPHYNSPFGFYRFKKNVNKNASAFKDETANKIINNDIEIKKEAPVTAASI